MITDKHLLFIVGAVAVCPKPLLGTVQANSIVGNMVMDEEAYEAFRKSTKYEHFNAVYAGSYAAVLRWIRGRVPADLAEELTQQTFMQYWQWLLAAAAFPSRTKPAAVHCPQRVRRPLPGHCCPGGVRGYTGGL